MINEQRWEAILRRIDLPGAALRKAIADSFTAWTRSFGGMNFHLTQLLSDHGCFQKFVYQIKKVVFSMCIYCKDIQDTAEHTMLVCQQWETERRHMVDILGCNDTLNGIIKAACEGKDKWQALNQFAQEVMIQKEILERETERVVGGTRSQSQDTQPRQKQDRRRRRRRKLQNIPEDEEEEDENNEEDTT